MPRSRFDRDYYWVLGVPPAATEQEIRRAYRRLALQWHPDRNAGDPAAAERFKAISEAYAVLIDPAKRGQYERARRAGTPGAFHPTREDLFRDLFDDPRASAIFEELAREFERLGLRVDRHVFRQTLFGGRAVVAGGIVIISPLTPLLALARVARAALRAARRAPAQAPDAEPRTGGWLGQILQAGRRLLGVAPAAPANVMRAQDVVIPLRLTRAEAEQGGQRRIALDRADRREEVLVTIPPGVGPGTRLRLRGKGRPTAGHSPGDAYLAVEITD